MKETAGWFKENFFSAAIFNMFSLQPAEHWQSSDTAQESLQVGATKKIQEPPLDGIPKNMGFPVCGTPKKVGFLLDKKSNLTL